MSEENRRRGRVKFFDMKKGFGFIVPFEGIQEHFVHRDNVVPISKTGIAGLFASEEVEYELGAKEDGRPAAFEVRPIASRLGGTVLDFDDDRGQGEIASDSDQRALDVHHSEILGPSTGRKYLAPGNPVEFEIAHDRGREIAVRVLLLDQRNPLERFARLPNLDRSLRHLAENLAEKEPWDYQEKPTGAFPILHSYIFYTFERLENEDKLRFAEDSSGIKLACLNTGLVTQLQEEILALFEENKIAKTPYDPRWYLKGFFPTSDRRTAAFEGDFPLANYFEDASELVLDWRSRIESNVNHIVRDRADRFPESLASNEASRRGAFEAAFRGALRRVQRNYKTAVPQYYRGSIQLLLPLCLEAPPRVDRALVLVRKEKTYIASTIFPLDWAYRNARLLAKPDREWLMP